MGSHTNYRTFKNVRTLQYDSKDMVKRITNYIVKQADNAASNSKEADVE